MRVRTDRSHREGWNIVSLYDVASEALRDWLGAEPALHRQNGTLCSPLTLEDYLGLESLVDLYFTEIVDADGTARFVDILWVGRSASFKAAAEGRGAASLLRLHRDRLSRFIIMGEEPEEVLCIQTVLDADKV